MPDSPILVQSPTTILPGRIVVRTRPLLDFKLHRPSVTNDLLERPHLYAKLDAGRAASLTLVSAPAGYGKSTLVAAWLERSVYPGAWLSLDEDDNNLVDFLSYFVAAIREVVARGMRTDIGGAKWSAHCAVGADPHPCE